MKKLLIGTFLIVTTCIIINSAFIFKTTPKQNIINNNNENNTSSNILSYIVKDFNGNIAVFNSIDENPIKIIDIYTTNLPKADQEMLLKGITVKNQAELDTLLEDLCS